jgi:hypothetical protein
MDVALGNFDDISESDDLVLSTLHIPSYLCLVIKFLKNCFNVTNLSPRNLITMNLLYHGLNICS